MIRDRLTAEGWDVDLGDVVNDVMLGDELLSWSGPIVLTRDGVRLTGKWIGEEGRAGGKIEDLDLLHDGREAFTVEQMSSLDRQIADYLGDPEAFDDETTNGGGVHLDFRSAK